MKRGLGKGKGFEVTNEYSLIEVADHPELLDLITDRIAVLYDMLYEDDESEDEEETDEFDFTTDDWEEI